jgi:hypothetical protein
MVDGDCSFMIDAATVFFDYFRIEGWFHSESDALVEVQLANTASSGITAFTGLPHPGVMAALGPGKGFCIQALITRSPDLAIVFHTKNRRTIKVRVLDLCTERKRSFEGRALLHRFIEMVNATKGARLLDLGGRARSGVEHSRMFDQADCTILDILPGDNVDVVGDAHAMSKLFPPNAFDAIFSTSVFEHLLMPWVVASEMSAVLRLGGVAYIATHQTLGMHDRPWDFWRFSDTAWDGLFNRLTGFEIIARALENPQYITPHFWSPEQGDHLERAVGFVGSAVLVRKTSEAQSRWAPVELASIIGSAYPETEEPIPSWHLNPASRGIF